MINNKKVAQALRKMPKEVDSMPKMDPMMSMDEDMMPGMAKMKVGEKHSLDVQVEVTGIRKDSMDGKMRGDFKIVKIGNKGKTMQDEDMEEEA